MATEPAKKVPRRRKAPETVRERAQKDSAKKEAPKKTTAVKARIHKPLSRLRRIGAKEYNPIKVPEKKGIKHLNKRVNLVPRYVRESWAELKLVTWPTKKEATQKTIAVIAFAIVIAILVQLLDLLFSKVVKEIILG